MVQRACWKRKEEQEDGLDRSRCDERSDVCETNVRMNLHSWWNGLIIPSAQELWILIVIIVRSMLAVRYLNSCCASRGLSPRLDLL